MSGGGATKYKESIIRGNFFQSVQTWPDSDELNFEGWLGNFADGEERDIACTILDFFTHYPKKMVEQMLKSSVSSAGQIFTSHFSDWEHENFKNRCLYSFIPGETENPTDSGHIFTRILRDKMRIPEKQIVGYKELAKVIPAAKGPLPIIFVDDFVGSGEQVYKAWNTNELLPSKTLGQMCIEGNHSAVYAPIIVNKLGFERINDDCRGLAVTPTHVLGDEYNLFNENCICWKGDSYLYMKGTKLILDKSRMLGIPSTGGHVVNDEMGFNKQGLAISFTHGAPDAIPAIFYWKENWTPLIDKEYDR